MLTAMERALATQKSNSHAVQMQQELKRRREDIAKEEVLEKAMDE